MIPARGLVIPNVGLMIPNVGLMIPDLGLLTPVALAPGPLGLPENPELVFGPALRHCGTGPISRRAIGVPGPPSGGSNSGGRERPETPVFPTLFEIPYGPAWTRSPRFRKPDPTGWSGLAGVPLHREPRDDTTRPYHCQNEGPAGATPRGCPRTGGHRGPPLHPSPPAAALPRSRQRDTPGIAGLQPGQRSLLPAPSAAALPRSRQRDTPGIAGLQPGQRSRQRDAPGIAGLQPGQRSR